MFVDEISRAATCAATGGPVAAARAGAVLLLATALLSACSPPPAPPLTAAQSEALHPADPVLAAKYDRACALCHARAGSGAPLVGDAAAWAPRLAKGDAALAASVAQGLGSMPPRGLCPDCSDAEVRALVRFLATGASR